MSAKEKLNKIEQDGKKWDIILTSTTLVIVATGSVALPCINYASSWAEWIIFGMIGFIVFGGIAIIGGKLIDKVVRKKWVKSYFIEDCGDVVKLHGSVSVDAISEAYKDLLSTRSGLRLVDDAFALYGCTFAAVNASDQEKKARDELFKNGIEIMTMSKC